MCKKLYYQDSHMQSFTATVISCEPTERGYIIQLDQTAFFPEGGGQSADTGALGDANVLDVQEKSGQILHLCDSPIEAGTFVSGQINWPQRFQRMQNHSGEHIVSGTIHKLFGYDNVGFHMKPGEVTIDFNGQLDEADIHRIQLMANQAVWDNIPITAEFPSSEELSSINYRSKLELTENVRIVTIPGVDVCACCAPHVYRTGEIGLIKITSHMKHRGGTRMTMICGGEAFEDYCEKHASVKAISSLLSVQQSRVTEAVERQSNELADLKYRFARASREKALSSIDRLEYTAGNLCLFETGLDSDSLRALVNAALPKCGSIVAGFSGSGESWQYIIASESVDLRAESKKINAALNGKGGGKPQMIQGSVNASKEAIEAYFKG